MKKTLLIAAFFLVTTNLFADNGYKTLPSCLRYKIFTASKGAKIVQGDMISLNFVMRTVKDSVVFSSYMTGESMEWKCDVPKYTGDFMEGLTLLSEGDSASFLLHADSVYKGMQMPPFLKHGDDIKL